MFKTFQGVTEDSSATIYLSPETAQGIFVNFKNICRTTRKKMPFGVGQIGKSFRNEITPGNFIFRIREFEQMELEFFCKPGTDLEWFDYWRSFCRKWLLDLGMTEENLTKLTEAGLAEPIRPAGHIVVRVYKGGKKYQIFVLNDRSLDYEIIYKSKVFKARGNKK